MPASRSATQSTSLSALGAQEWLVALAGLTSVALIIAACLDFGDPIERAQLEVEKEARLRAELVSATYERILARPEPPAPVLGMTVTIPASPLIQESSKGSRSKAKASTPSDRIVPVLIESGLFEAASGSLDEAVREMESVLTRAPDDPRALEARLHLARWASARGDAQEVRAQRAAILGSGEPPRCWLEGTSVALLSTLVDPIDVKSAAALLGSPLEHLPMPLDDAVLEPGIRIQLDPWWQELRRRLAAADPAVDWDALFLLEERAGTAVARRLGSALQASEAGWTLQRREEGLLAARPNGNGGVRVAALSTSGLAESVQGALPMESVAPFEIRFSDVGSEFSRETAGEDRSARILPPTTLGPDALAFAVHREDPLREGRREAAFLRLVRASLVALALGILVTTALSARATGQARRLARLRSTFVASVSHDLRTPIQSMLLMSETLEQDRVASEAGRKRYFGSIRREAQRLRRMVEDLLDGARIDRGEGARVQRQSLDAARYFDELESLMLERAERADGELTFVRGSLPAVLHVDPDGLHRAAWNLFENALKYGRQKNASARVTVSFAVEGDVLFLQVDDEGPGIPARLAESLFQPFERAAVDSGRSEETADTGTGLGLSIVRAITRAHGGDARLVLGAEDVDSSIHSDATYRSPLGARFVATFASVLNSPS